METLAIVTAVLDVVAGTIGLFAALMHLALVVRLRRDESDRGARANDAAVKAATPGSAGPSSR